MDGQVINISLPSKLLKLADQVAEREARTRSELFREAIRSYVLRMVQWDEVFAYGDKKARQLKVNEQDIEQLISEYRTNSKQ
jgi:predicted transcriptional regulator